MAPIQNPKVERFAQALARGTDYKRAYVEAGYKPSRSNAHALSTRKDVVERVSELIAIEANAAGVTLESVVAELRAIAFLDARDFFAWDRDGVSVKASDTLSDQQAKAVVGVKETIKGTGANRERTIEVKLGDKRGALETLLKHLAPQADSNVTNNLVLISPLEQVSQRLAGLSERLTGQPAQQSLPAPPLVIPSPVASSPVIEGELVKTTDSTSNMSNLA